MILKQLPLFRENHFINAMSIFAGVLARQSDGSIPAQLMEELRASVSRHPDDLGRLREFKDDKVFMVKVDIGALNAAGEYGSPEMAAFVAGDPLLQSHAGALPALRSEGLAAVAHDLVLNRHHSLRSCRGTFCAVAYEKSTHKLHLVTDKLGVRPIYCWVLPDFILFATALRILEAVSFFRRSLHLQGAAEIACYGAALADRTPYQGIFCLLAGEVVSADGAGALQRVQYWRWDELPVAQPSEAPVAQRIYRHFQEAVQIRLGDQKAVAAHLSGGLDSRAVVAALQAGGAEVCTVNFSLPDSQDQVLGQLAAERLGTHHTSRPVQALLDGDRHSNATVRDWLNSAAYLAHQPERPRVIWSGDGGGECLGHVHLNADIVAATRADDLDGAVDKFMAYNRWSLSAKLLKPRIAKTLADLSRSGMLSELRSVHPADKGRVFHLFLVLNQQHRHLASHFENLDMTRTELEVPFFDSEFLSAIVREKIDPFLRHSFYLDWLRCFPPGVLEIAWQAYPDHVPCPLPLPPGLGYQWDEATAKAKRKTSGALLAEARQLAGEAGFADEFLRYGYMHMCMALLRLGRNEYDYLLHAPAVLHRYWLRSHGEARRAGPALRRTAA
nr:asparagine synthase-related protein [Acidovorax sp. SRB_24]